MVRGVQGAGCKMQGTRCRVQVASFRVQNRIILHCSLIFKFSNFQILTLLIYASAFAFMQFLCVPILGNLSDKYGRRPVLLFSLFGMIGAACGLGFIIGPVIGGLLGSMGSRVPFNAGKHYTGLPYVQNGKSSGMNRFRG